jgi:hypothetical protein
MIIRFFDGSEAVPDLGFPKAAVRSSDPKKERNVRRGSGC